MNVQSVLGKKINQTQGFLEDGTRIPLSLVAVKGNFITALRTLDKDGYQAVQMGFGINTKATKPLKGIAKKAGIENTPRFFREVRVEDVSGFELGKEIDASSVLKPGDIIDVVGTSKGKGYAGVVKRHGFHGGPKTHGQSDRHRAPGSSGQGTTPGRVYKGKRMAGNMGAEQVTMKNLVVMDVVDGVVYVKGLIPGYAGQFVVINKRGVKKKFMPLFRKADEAAIEITNEKTGGPAATEEAVSQVIPATEEVKEQEAEATVAEIVSKVADDVKEVKTAKEDHIVKEEETK